MNLTAPLSAEQIAAASRLHAQFPEWNAIDSALSALGERCPDYGANSALLKVAALNSLYGTNVYPAVRMANHIARTMASPPQGAGPVALVEELALLPADPPGARETHYISFASKFCHFFVDPARYPISDSYAVATITFHMGKRQVTRNSVRRYWAFVQDLDRLRDSAGISCSLQEMDRYLWLAGVYRAWRANHNAQINVEIKRGFTKPSPEMQADLALLAPEAAIG
jgi:hypothetical protein